MSRSVQLTTDPEPRPTYEVSEAEYERLLDLGVVANAPAAPVDPDLFDQEVAQLSQDVNTLTRSVLDGRYVVSESVNQSQRIGAIRPLTQGAYYALTNVDAATLYVIIPG